MIFCFQCIHPKNYTHDLYCVVVVYKSLITHIAIAQHGAHLGPAGPRWAPCWPHEPCYQGKYQWRNPAGYMHASIHPQDPLRADNVNKISSLGPSDAIWWQRCGSKLAQIMACCLTAPSHYLNQFWFILSKVQWYSSDGNFIRIPQPSITKCSLKITYLKSQSNLPGANELDKTEQYETGCLLFGMYCMCTELLS